MTRAPEPGRFRSGLTAWAWRGALGAAPSFYGAVVANFQQPTQIAEMGRGVATHGVGLAWLTARPRYLERGQSSPCGWALRLAANLRAALAPLMFFGPDLVHGGIGDGWRFPEGAVVRCARGFAAGGRGLD